MRNFCKFYLFVRFHAAAVAAAAEAFVDAVDFELEPDVVAAADDWVWVLLLL